MATLKLTLDSRREYTDKRLPVIFRLTLHTKSTSIDSNVKVLAKDWDFEKSKILKTHPDSKKLNIYLKNRLLELEKLLIEHDSTLKSLNVVELKKFLLKTDESEEITFYNFALKEIALLKDQERFGNAQSYETAVNRLIKHAGKDIALSKIDYLLLSNFDVQLIKEGLSRNSIAAYMREIRAILNIAIKKKLLNQAQYPFSSYKIKTQKTINRAITKMDIQKIKTLPLKEGSPEWHYRNIFMLIFNLIGISFIDLVLLKADNIQNDRIVYTRRKTGKVYSIKLTDEAHSILKMYRTVSSRYLIPFFGLENVLKANEREEIALRLKTCNKYLKRIGKHCNLPIQLTTYVARYAWANIAKSLNYPKDQIAEALGHEYGNRITGIYLDNYGNDVIDEMNKRVVEIRDID